jgi:hypothetical protein
MNVVDVYPKDIHASLEISIKEIAKILTFYDDARPLYDKVFADSMGEEGEYMENEFIAKLRQVFENVQKGM